MARQDSNDRVTDINPFQGQGSQNAIIATVDSVRTRASTRGTLITFEVPDEYSAKVAIFLTKIGHQVALAFADVENEPTRKPRAREFGDAAKALKLAGFFRKPEVWRAIGTDEEFRQWIQRQPSAWSGEFSEYVDGEGRCEAAHVSRIEYGRGMGHKPEYACVPLTHAEHMLHHAKGESVFDRELPNGEGIERGRQWMERMRVKYVEQWAWNTLKTLLGQESMADIDPKLVTSWATKADVYEHLPYEFR